MNRFFFGSACTRQLIVSGMCGALAVAGGCSSGSKSKAAGSVRLDLPGGKAGEMDASLLASVHSNTSQRAPAAIRPDPDTYIRALLRQYREEGPLIARDIGRVEDYRPLLGGANEDFSKAPQESYDATSLLAVQKVSEEICRSLIAPGSDHPGWNTILPAPAAEATANIRFLAQRFIGLPSSQISAEALAALESILNDARSNGQITLDSYIPVCVALSVDAEALLL